jgi:NAD(P)-dependent dehydrogenase (short-subunit alcohol dehydrogenase family)
MAISCDVRKFADVSTAVTQAIASFGGIDILVNSAGLIRKSRLENIIEADWDLQFDVNVKGMLLVTQAVVREWLQAGWQGKIINISSVHGRISFPEASAYAATKGAVDMFTKSLASELAPYKINVNAIAPGAIDTELNIAFYTVPVRAAMCKRIPWGEIGDPADVGYAAAFLASEKARYITGEILYVDGGLSMDGREVIE